MEKILQFKKEYAKCLNYLSDKDAGKFIKCLSSYFFDKKVEDLKNPMLGIYFSLIEPELEKERLQQEEMIELERVNTKKNSQKILDLMFQEAKDIEDLIDYEVSKLFVKEGKKDG